MVKEVEIATEHRRCVKVEVAVLGSLSLRCPYGLCGRKATCEEEAVNVAELRSCVKVQMTVLGSPSLIIPTVSVDVKRH